MKPLVSIITPCYNSENYLERYLNNILLQSYARIELIIVNDGSTDNTEKIVLSYINMFKENNYSLVYVKQENTGLGGAINTALKYITGEYFTWCDSDNFYTNDYVETKIDFFIKNPQYSIVRCDGYIVSDSNIYTPIATMVQRNTDKFQEKMFDYCLTEHNFHFGCAMLRTADFDKVNPNREIYPSREGQNWQLLLPMFYYYKSGYIDKQMFYFVHREESVSNRANTLDKRIIQIEEYKNIQLKTIEAMNIEDSERYIKDIKKRFALRVFWIAIASRNFNKMKEYYQYLKEIKMVNRKIRKAYIRSYFSLEYLIHVKHKLFN